VFANIVNTNQQQVFVAAAAQNAYLNGSRGIAGFNGVDNAIRTANERRIPLATGGTANAAFDRGPYTRPARVETSPLLVEMPQFRIDMARAREAASRAERADTSLSSRLGRAFAGCCNPLARHDD
jgi:hypothetical protein